MPTFEAHVSTDRAERYLQQLCGHLGRMQHMRHLPLGGHGDRSERGERGGPGMPRVEHVERTEGHAAIRFAEGTCTLTADASALRLWVEADDPAALARLKDAITTRIEKIGRRDGLSIAWHELEDPAQPDGPEAVHSR
jgi:hypothetical protein